MGQIFASFLAAPVQALTEPEVPCSDFGFCLRWRTGLQHSGRLDAGLVTLVLDPLMDGGADYDIPVADVDLRCSQAFGDD